MLMNLRNALMAGKRLPYDAEVEFLQSSGTQYINTGIMGASEWHITAQGAAAPTTSNCVIATTSLGGSFFGNYGAIDYWAVGNGSSWRCSLPYTSIGSFIVTFSASSVQFTVNGETVTRLSAPNFSKTFYLFSTNGEGFGATVRVYGCKVYQNGVLVRDYIPVRVGTVGYLYDRVTGKLFGNAGTGDFVLGPDVVPVEYILQTGTQYIDTLYPMADTRREVITVDWSGHSTTYREFMAGAASGSYLIEMSPTGYYGTAYNDYSSIHVSTKDKIRWDYTVGVKPYLYINDVLAIQDSLRRVPKGNIQTGGVGTPGANYPKMKIYSLDVYTDNSVQVRKMLPIRVGTDATSWEGAMMDTLTRRIYRNAGTGAFSYGNDRRYPIPA